MPSAKDVRSSLKPFVGSMTAFNNSDALSKILFDDEKIELAGQWKVGNIAVLTKQRLIFFEGTFKVKQELYDRDKIKGFHTERTTKHDYLKFIHDEIDIVYPVDRSKKITDFAIALEKTLGSVHEDDHGIKEKVDLKGKTSVGLDIINGADQLEFKAQIWYVMYQEVPGEVKFATESRLPLGESFKLIGFDRTENFKRSISNIIGAAALGRIYGTAGAITGAIAAQNIGKDFSTASILLQRKDGVQFILIVKCNQDTLKQLQTFITYVVKNEEKQPSPTLSPADEIKKYKELLDMDAITQDEFDAKKKQLLGL
jgi:hypothetical protein